MLRAVLANTRPTCLSFSARGLQVITSLYSVLRETEGVSVRELDVHLTVSMDDYSKRTTDDKNVVMHA